MLLFSRFGIVVALFFCLLTQPAWGQNTRPIDPQGYPIIAGDWEEVPGYAVKITQSGGSFTAMCTYGNVSWRMDGRITRDGSVSARLQHTAGVASSARGYAQDRRMTLSADGRTLQGTATFTGGSHPLTWRRTSPLPVSSPPSSPPSPPSPPTIPTSGTLRVREFHDVCRDCGQKRVDLGEHDFCALTGFVIGGFNSGCNIGRSGSLWYLDITDPGPPDPWQGESQECRAMCFTIAR